MLKYIVKRIILMIPVLVFMTIVVFSIFYFAPGDPVSRIAGPNVTPEVYESIKRKYGLDQPYIVQYWRFMKSVIEGDLGISILQERPVIEMIKERMPVTLEIGFLGFLITFVIAVPAGVIAAVKKNTFVDYLCMSGSLLGIAIPTFWFGMLLMYFFSYKLRWFPISGYGTIKHLILPSFAIGLTNAAITARMVRSSMLEVLKQDYVRTARSKGLLEKIVIYRHALKNAMITIITLMGLRLGWIIGGAVALEIIFSIPGIGRLMVDAILARDFPVVLGAMLVLTSSIIFANILADVLYAVVDPRIRYG